MKLHQLELLCALEQYHSFSKASEHLFLSQPALSASMKALENELGCTLLARSNKGVQFTPAGKAALEIAHNILNEMTLIRAIASDAKKMPDNLTLASNTLGCIDLLLGLFRQISIGGTEAFVHLQEIDAHTLMYQLLYGTLDFAILQVNTLENALPADVLDAKISFLRLAQEPLVVLVRSDHPLAAQREISARALFAYPFLTTHAETDQRILQDLRQKGFSAPAREIRDTASLNKLLSESDHWAFVPESESRRHENDPHHALTVLHLTDLPCVCTYFWLRKNDHYPEEEAVLVQAIRELLEEKQKEATL